MIWLTVLVDRPHSEIPVLMFLRVWTKSQRMRMVHSLTVSRRHRHRLPRLLPAVDRRTRGVGTKPLILDDIVKRTNHKQLYDL